MTAGLTLPLAARADVLFGDKFTRADNTTAIDATLGGITDNTGSSLAAGGVYARPFSKLTTSSQIAGNQLKLATGTGSSNAYIDHNFTNGNILTDGGFRVSVDVTGMNKTTAAGKGGSFSVGMSKARANSAGDALFARTKMQDGISGDGNAATSQSIADFWVMLRGDGSLVWGGLGNSITGSDESGLLGKVDVGSKTGLISAVFTLSSFNAAETVNYEVFFDGVSKGSGSFTWSESNQNYIGLDARDKQGVTFDNLSIETIPEPATLGLIGSVGIGVLFIRRRLMM